MKERIAYLKNIKDKIISIEEIEQYEYVLVNTGYMCKFVNSDNEEIKKIVSKFLVYDKMYSRLNKKNLAYYPIKTESLKVLMEDNNINLIALKTDIQDETYIQEIEADYFVFKNKQKIFKKAN